MADFRVIPSIEQLRQRPGVMALEQAHGHGATISALRAAASALRARIAGGGDHAPADAAAAAGAIESDASARLAQQFRGSLRRVINATGVIVHTNLGRAPLAPAAIARIEAVAQGYSNLEYDISKGERGSRTVHAEHLLTTLTGAEAAIVVNNNAAATMFILAGLAAGREVIISRGELVEIGGGFRVPDVMTQSGAVLREIGTTNRTRVSDYAAAISDKTAAILRVHPSNFRIEGFTERPALTDLTQLAAARGILLLEDLGSGSLVEELSWEPAVQASVSAGADIICFSGDKLLGGPQAGIIIGRAALIDRLRRHPLMRALRVDKLTLAALEGTLLEYLSGRANDTIPVLRMIQMAADAIETRAQALANTLLNAGWTTALLSGSSTIGGGSAPGVELPTVLLAIARAGMTADQLEARLRAGDPPVIARIEDDRVVLDLRTVEHSDDARLIAALQAVVL